MFEGEKSVPSKYTMKTAGPISQRSVECEGEQAWVRSFGRPLQGGREVDGPMVKWCALSRILKRQPSLAEGSC